MDSLKFSGKEVLDMAARIELNGEAFYKEARNIVKHESLKKLFLFLEKQEKVHYNDFKRLSKLGAEEKITNLSQLSEDKEMHLYLNALADSRVFSDSEAGAELGKKVKDDEDAIKIAIDLEKDSILFYSEMLKIVQEVDKKMVNYLIEEERDHIKRLKEWKA